MYMSLLIMYIHIYVYDMWAFSCMFIYMRALYMICVICFMGTDYALYRPKDRRLLNFCIENSKKMPCT